MAENQSDDSIGDMITKWRQESKKKFKLDRIKKMVFDSKMNKKPSEYQPEDFIPRIRTLHFFFLFVIVVFVYPDFNCEFIL